MCRDLFGDGTAYTRYRVQRLLGRRGRRTDDADPSPGLPPYERRAVRVYGVVLVVGTTLCLAFFAAVTLPADLTLFARAAVRSASGRPAWDRLDGIAVLVTPGGPHALWLRTWWRGRRLRRTPSRPSR